MSFPVYLNTYFKLVSYNGGEYSAGNSITNFLQSIEPEQHHISSLGTNFDLVLEYTKETEFLFSHFEIAGCKSFPIHTGYSKIWFLRRGID